MNILKNSALMLIICAALNFSTFQVAKKKSKTEESKFTAQMASRQVHSHFFILAIKLLVMSLISNLNVLLMQILIMSTISTTKSLTIRLLELTKRLMNFKKLSADLWQRSTISLRTM